jgi:hypothetical protein
MLLPSPTNTALATKSVWPFRVASGLASRSHSCVVFTEAIRTQPPSGANAAVTVLSWPCGEHRFAPGVIFDSHLLG